MKKWKTPTVTATASYWCGVAPDDPNIWSDVSNLIPANGAYVVPEGYVASSAIAATGETASSVLYAFAGEIPAGTSRSYVVGTKIWEYTVGAHTLTDRTGVAVFGFPQMAQYGTATIMVDGNAAATYVSTGGNFAVLAGAPKGEIVVTCSNAVLIFNGDGGTRYEDGWWASDVGDYTNWSTGESASGRLIQTPGRIVAAVSFRDCVYVFKASSIYRGRYVGGVVKWTWEVVDWTIGIDDPASSGMLRKHAAVACKDGIAFVSFKSATAATPCVRLFDGANPPVILNPETYLTFPTVPFFHYDPRANRLWITGADATAHLCYSFSDDAWGNATSNAGAVAASITGAWAAMQSGGFNPGSTRPPRWVGGTDTLTLWYSAPVSEVVIAFTSYVQTHKIGSWDLKTGVKRATPVLRYRKDTGIAGPNISMTYSLFTERHDLTARSGPTSVTKSTTRDRFDWTAADTYHQIKMTFTNMNIAVDNIDVKAQAAGTD